jgi:hypothetical protein
MHCWNGNHGRCTGWCVIPDESAYGRAVLLDQSIICECRTCFHRPVARDRHLHEDPSRGGPWSSLTITPS